MEVITLGELVRAVGGKLLGPCTDESIMITGAVSDNRKVENGYVFFAYPGEKSDGHKYVPAALSSGAAGCVVSKDPGTYMEGKFYVLTQDTIRAAGDFAAYYRRCFAVPAVAVTGSVGKTTTKDMIASVLSERFNVVKTQANFNNNIGLPRTILSIGADTQIAVLEMGMNHRGEIDYLTRIAKPDVCTITNIGEAHIGNLGSKENIFKAKCEIFNGLTDGGLAVMNGDDEFLVKLREDAEKQRRFHFVFIGEAQNCDFRAVNIRDTLPEELMFTAVTPTGTYDIDVPAAGRHLIYPALTAAAIGAYYGMSNEEIAAGIAHYTATGMRMETLHLPGNRTLYNDTYNANPQSMKAGLVTLSHTAGVRRIAVLGDMFELGEREEELHREVGAFAAGLSIDTLVTTGRAAAYIAEEAKKNGLSDVRACADKREAKAVLDKILLESPSDTAFLFKASRGMALEELFQYVKEKEEQA